MTEASKTAVTTGAAGAGPTPPQWEKYLSCESLLRQPSVMKMPFDPECVSLTIGVPNPECFPLKGMSLTFESPEHDFTTLQTASHNHIDGEAPKDIKEISQYFPTSGITAFAPWINAHIEKYHKPAYEGWGHILQAGGTQALDAIFRTLLDPAEDTVLAEEYTYSCFLETCKPLRAKVFSVAMTPAGVDVAAMDKLLSSWYTSTDTRSFKKPKLFYTMPTGHNPTSVTMTDDVRANLMAVCRKHDVLIVEDDPYFHLQLDAQSPPSLLKYDTDGRVLRIDSFSKMLMPGMRVAVVTCNKLFAAKLAMYNELSIHSAAAPSQLILSMIFNQWKDKGFEAWISHLQGIYKKRRDHMLGAFDTYVPSELVEFNRPAFGMFVWITLREEAWPNKNPALTQAQWLANLEDRIFDAALANKVAFTKGKWFYAGKPEDYPHAAFRATYSFADAKQTTQAAERFAHTLKAIHAELYN